MLKNLSRAAALATVLGCLAVASPSVAAPFDNGQASGAPNSSVTLDQNGNVVNKTADTSENGATETQAPQTAPTMHHHHGMAKGAAAAHTPEMMQERVEERIKTLHAKLEITKDQESQWNDVAQAMRDSEANISSLIQERHQNIQSATAVDDLESYQKIAQAHADGLKNVTASFATLYSNMSDAQKKNADKVFGTYEGHMGGAHKALTKGKAMSPAGVQK